MLARCRLRGARARPALVVSRLGRAAGLRSTSAVAAVIVNGRCRSRCRRHPLALRRDRLRRRKPQRRRRPPRCTRIKRRPDRCPTSHQPGRRHQPKHPAPDPRQITPGPPRPNVIPPPRPKHHGPAPHIPHPKPAIRTGALRTCGGLRPAHGAGALRLVRLVVHGSSVPHGAAPGYRTLVLVPSRLAVGVGPREPPGCGR